MALSMCFYPGTLLRLLQCRDADSADGGWEILPFSVRIRLARYSRSRLGFDGGRLADSPARLGGGVRNIYHEG